MELRAGDPRQDAPLPDPEEPRQIAHGVGRENGAGRGRHAERRAPAHGVRKPEGKDKRESRLGKKTPVGADLISADEDRKGTIAPHSKELSPPAQLMRRPYQPERAAAGPAGQVEEVRMLNGEKEIAGAGAPRSQWGPRNALMDDRLIAMRQAGHGVPASRQGLGQVDDGRLRPAERTGRDVPSVIMIGPVRDDDTRHDSPVIRQRHVLPLTSECREGVHFVRMYSQIALGVWCRSTCSRPASAILRSFSLSARAALTTDVSSPAEGS